MTAILDVVQVFICVGLIFLILMHSGKDAGLSGAFGVGTGAGPLGGGSLVERNLNRWTVLFAVAVCRQHDRPDQNQLTGPPAERDGGRGASLRWPAASGAVDAVDPVALGAETIDQPQQVQGAERLGQEQIRTGRLGLGLDPVPM